MRVFSYLIYKDKPLDYMKSKTNEILNMSDPNMITAYSWAAGLLFQQELPTSLTDVEKRARLVIEINTQLIRGEGTWHSLI